ncbi:putative recombinase [Oscillibacter valericigenes Sjm18-20]|nr:putative recombinase [Oscillibacter valericigenes Sjm18-20]
MVAIYARQSIDKKDSISIDTQIELCKRQLPDGTPCVVYPDKGYSGSNINRPEFQRLLEDVKSGKIDRIITYRLDRISRSVLDFANLVDLFNKHGVSFNSTQETFDTGTPIGRAMLNIVMTFAQLERETIQIRIRDNYYARGEKGMYLGGPAPFGFRKIETQTEQGKLKFLKANPETVQVLMRMFQMYGNDLMSLGGIARQFNVEKIPSPSGVDWDSSKVSRILRNPVAVMSDADVYRYYRDRGVKFTNEVSDFTLGKGCYLYGKRKENQRKFTDVSNHTLSLAPHDGVIPSDLFLRCEERLDSNRQIDNRMRSKLSWLTGLLKCGKCGHAVVLKSSYNGKYRYLYCTGKTAYNCCDVEGNLGSLDTVEALVRDRILCWAKRYRDLAGESAVAENRSCNQLRCQMEDVDTRIAKLIDMAAESSDMTVQYLDAKVQELTYQRQELESQLNHLSEGHRDALTKQIRDIESEWNTLGLAAKSRLAELLITRINVFKDGLDIEWAYNFDLK